MGLDIKTIVTLAKFLNGSGNFMLPEILSGNKDVLGKVAADLGVEPSDENISDILSTAQSYSDNKVDIGNEIRNTLMGSPGDWLTRAVISSGKNATGSMRDYSLRKGERLANALLAGRTQSESNVSRYGKSPSSVALEAAAQKRLLKVDRNAAIWGTLSNIISELGNTYATRDDMARNMTAAEKAQLPGAFYTGMASKESTAEKMSRPGRN